MHPSRQAYVEEAEPEVSLVLPTTPSLLVANGIHKLSEAFQLYLGLKYVADGSGVIRTAASILQTSVSFLLIKSLNRLIIAKLSIAIMICPLRLLALRLKKHRLLISSLSANAVLPRSLYRPTMGEYVNACEKLGSP